MAERQHYSHDVQLVHFAWDQVEERGPVDADAAVAAFRNFPFEAQQLEARSLPEPTFPTVTFRSQGESAVLSIWSLEPRSFEVYLDVNAGKLTVEETSSERIEAIIRDFFSGDQSRLHERLSTMRGAVVQRPGLLNRLKALFGGGR